MKSWSNIQILPFLKEPLRRQLADLLPPGREYALRSAPGDFQTDSDPRDILHYIETLAHKPHVVLWQINAAALGNMESCDGFEAAAPGEPSRDAIQTPAMIAVFEEASGQDVIRALNLDFDGFLTSPFAWEIVEDTLLQSLQRNRKKQHMRNRYLRMRTLCRLMNGRRRQLRNKVDLLCNDLVQSNRQMSATLTSLQKAYDFQGDLLGEYDLQYLLFKSLQEMKKSLPETAAAVYLCRSGQFEAHLEDVSGPGVDMEMLETSLQNAVVKKVLRLKKTMALAGYVPVLKTSDELAQAPAPLAILSLPIRYAREMVGVLVFYRSAENPFSRKEESAILPYLSSLGRAIAGLHKLQDYLQNIG